MAMIRNFSDFNLGDILIDEDATSNSYADEEFENEYTQDAFDDEEEPEIRSNLRPSAVVIEKEVSLFDGNGEDDVLLGEANHVRASDDMVLIGDVKSDPADDIRESVGKLNIASPVVSPRSSHPFTSSSPATSPRRLNFKPDTSFNFNATNASDVGASESIPVLHKEPELELDFKPLLTPFIPVTTTSYTAKNMSGHSSRRTMSRVQPVSDLNLLSRSNSVTVGIGRHQVQHVVRSQTAQGRPVASSHSQNEHMSRAVPIKQLTMGTKFSSTQVDTTVIPKELNKVIKVTETSSLTKTIACQTNYLEGSYTSNTKQAMASARPVEEALVTTTLRLGTSCFALMDTYEKVHSNFLADVIGETFHFADQCE
jgi:hypothetical protein